MEILSVEFFMALGTLILLDLLLGGDNAVVIAMAANKLPPHLRRKAILIGTGGAVLIRLVMTLAAVWLLSVPYLQAIGGLVLLPIAVKLLLPEKGGAQIAASENLMGAVKTIIIADAAMGVDNVLAIAGASHGSFLLVVLGFLISIPIIAVVAIPLKLESPGPLFFKQRRVGLNGRYFTMYKLRSMYVDAEERKKELMAKNEMNGLMFKMEDDPRITKVGKFIRKTSIDELPQFINVLCGQMSLVGTRPPTVDEYRQYESHHKRRLSMKPGITGMWQACGRSNIENFEDVVRMDVQYIDNWSLKLDIQLLFKTVGVVFTGKGAK